MNARWWAADRAALALSVVLAAGFLAYVDSFYAVGDWLFFRYLAYAAVAAAWLACCAAGGHFVLESVLRLRLPRHEQLIQAVSVGVFGFALGWFLLGIARLWTPLAALLWPILFAAPGGLAFWRRRRGWLRWIRALRPAPLSWLGRGALLLGLLGLVLVYLPLLHPDNVNFDTRVYHQALAEHYVADGGITAFREGWLPGANPQLATYLYGWAYALPWPRLFDRVELSLHLEFALFLFTLASVSVLVRRLLGGRWVPLSWLSMLAFPELFCPGSMLAGAADHIAAAFAVPLFLALLRAVPALDARACALFGVQVAAVLSTKYTAYGLLLVPLLVFGGRSATLLIHARWLGPFVFAAALLVLWAPHWLKNLVWYGDPVYPFLHQYLSVAPWGVRAAERLSSLFLPGTQAERSLGGALESLGAAFTFSFVPRDFWHFHRDLPVFGSLFTLSLPFAALVRPSPRLWLLYAAALVAVVHWFWSYHFDRYLQVYLPWMAATVAAVAANLWGLGSGARAGVLILAGVQLVWGADVAFFPTHAVLKTSPHLNSIRFLASGFTRKPDRFSIFDEYTDIGRALPARARVLLHDQLLRLGLGRAVVSDAAVRQFGIDYALDPSPRGVFASLRELGVTHLVWETDKSRGFDTLAGDIAFHEFALQHAGHARRFGRFSLAQMPRALPAPRKGRAMVLVLGCDERYASGLYELSKLSVQPLTTPRAPADYPAPERRAMHEQLGALAEQALALVIDPKCHTAPVPAGFGLAFERGDEDVYLRRPER